MAHEHVSKSEYEGVIKEMGNDLNRSERERAIERAFEKNLPLVLRQLNEKHDGNKSAVLREINEQLEDWGSETNLSRGTLYNYFEKYLDD